MQINKTTCNESDLLTESVCALAGGIAHRINNFFMGIQGNAALMLMEIDPDHSHYQKLKNIEQYVQEGADLIKRLLDFARDGKYEVRPADMNEILDNSIELFSKTKYDLPIQAKSQEGIWATDVDQGQIEFALLILYVNAWQTMSGNGELYVQTQNVTFDEYYAKQYAIAPGGYVKISVTDTGAGLDGFSKQRIFDSLLDIDELDAGRRLGLISVCNIINKHGGIVTAYSEKGSGTTFNIYLPVSLKEFVQEEEFAEVLSHAAETALLIDDEEMILDVGRQMLEKLGYKVLTAENGKKGLEIYRRNPEQIDIVILDVIMPELGGGETYDRLKEMDPDVRVLLSSGYGINRQINEIMDRGCDGFIQKPFNMKQFSRKIRKILEKEPQSS